MPRFHLLPPLTAVWFFLLGAGCGGGSSRDNDNSSGFQVVSISPADGATDVAYQADIVITFSGVVREASLTGGVELLDPDGIPVQVASQASGKVATVSPRNQLSYRQTYQIRVSTAVRDESDRPLTAEVTSSFTVMASADDSEGPVLLDYSFKDQNENLDAHSELWLVFDEYLDEGSFLPGLLLKNSADTAVGFAVARHEMVDSLLYKLKPTQTLSYGMQA